MIYGIAIALITLTIDIITDLKRWMDGRGVNHFRGAILRLVGLVPACYLCGWASFIILSSYMILFNGILAMLKGYDFLYIGTTAKTDKLLKKLPKWALVLFYFTILTISIIIYVISGQSKVS